MWTCLGGVDDLASSFLDDGRPEAGLGRLCWLRNLVLPEAASPLIGSIHY